MKSPLDPHLRLATRVDREAILCLLADSTLPLEGVVDHLDHFVVAESGGRLIGCAGLELYGRYALLRSVAVKANARGSGIGSRLLEAITALGRDRRVDTLFLLTTTAADYFSRSGFERIERAALPDALHRSRELQGACPSSAIVMMIGCADGPAG
ncbi:hypothetical protein BH09PSE6_BH09PSE6_08720 [soil metagenome]